MADTVQVKCKGSGELALDEMVELQGELKALDRANYKKLRAQMIKLGFSAPFFIWRTKQGKNFLLDGHQRFRALQTMAKEGINLPKKYPVVWVEAKDKKEAKRKLLAITSNYGKVNNQGLYEFMYEADMGLDELSAGYEFSDVNIMDFSREFFETGSAELNDDERLKQMTFYLDASQAETVKAAIKKAARASGHEQHKNKNTIAITSICHKYLNDDF